jgi:flagellar biosynthesis protein FliQ
MNEQAVLSISQNALQVAIMVSAPLLLTALVVGLVVSILQAATQINEATLSFIPKLLGVFAATIVAGPWMVTTLVDYIKTLFESIPHVIG